VRVVLDTNIFIAALLTKGLCNTILAAWEQDEKFELLTSEWQIDELKRNLREKFSDVTTPKERASLISALRASAFILRLHAIPDLSIDPDDNHILGIALEGQADYLVSLDAKHVLNLKKVEKTRILPPKDFVKVIKPKKKAKNPTK
jgi:uncharacterized protein